MFRAFPVSCESCSSLTDLQTCVLFIKHSLRPRGSVFLQYEEQWKRLYVLEDQKLQRQAGFYLNQVYTEDRLSFLCLFSITSYFKIVNFCLFSLLTLQCMNVSTLLHSIRQMKPYLWILLPFTTVRKTHIFPPPPHLFVVPQSSPQYLYQPFPPAPSRLSVLIMTHACCSALVILPVICPGFVSGPCASRQYLCELICKVEAVGFIESSCIISHINWMDLTREGFICSL